MFNIRTTAAFDTWFAGLRDRTVQRRIQARIDRLELGNAGKMRVLTRGVCELKIDVGPGFRVYYVQRGNTVVILLCGGDKSTQRADIDRALAMVDQLED